MKEKNIDMLVSCMDRQSWPYTQHGNTVVLDVMGELSPYRVIFSCNNFIKICCFFYEVLPSERIYEGFPFIFFMNKNLDFGSLALEGGQLYFSWTLPNALDDLEFLLEEIISACDRFEPLWHMIVEKGNISLEVMEAFIRPADGHA